MDKYMKICFIFISISIFFSPISNASYKDLTDLLAKIQQAEASKLPKTAIDLAKELEKKSKEEKEFGLYIRALAKRMINEAYINGNQPKERITYLLKHLKNESVPSETRPLLKAILAIWFTEYYQQNTFKFRKRTQIDTVANISSEKTSKEDFLDWDLTKIQNEIETLFSEATKDNKDKEKLKQVNIEKYRGLIDVGNIFHSKDYSLYDFLIRENINFYSTFFISTPKAEDEDDALLTSSPVFSDHHNFITLRPDQFPNLFYKKAFILYQELLKYYKEKNKTEMYLDTELARLNLLKEKGVGSDKLDILQKHLISLITEFKSLPTSALAQYHLSLIYSEQDDLSKAVQICNEAINKFKDSDGAKYCKNQINNISQKSFSADIENTIDQFNQKINIQYKNINELHFKIFKVEWEKVLTEKWSNLGESLNRPSIDKMLSSNSTYTSTKADAEWSVKLPTTIDYKSRSETIDLPKLPYGFYYLFISEKKDYTPNTNNDNQIIYNSFWYTDTTLLVKNFNQQLQGLVINSANGKPLEGKIVKLFKRNNQKDGIYEFAKKASSNKDGFFIFDEDTPGYDYAIKAESEDSGDVVFHQNFYVVGKSTNNNSINDKYHTALYTDRAIYRPGQRIQYKVICLKINNQNNLHQVHACKNMNVRLYDQNGREVAKTTNKAANEWGSFSGDFVIPNNILNGQMRIATDNSFGSRGQTTIQVEEYKRPKFEVKLKSLSSQKEFILNSNVEAEGSAISYSGVAIAKAKVKYRVTRKSHFPKFFYSWFNFNLNSNFPNFTNNKEIANGQTITDEKGNFKVEFIATADSTIDKNFKPFFTYNLEVQVVDVNGETQACEKLYTFGYVALKAEMNLSEWLIAGQELNLTILTKNLDNNPIDNNGTVTIFNLKMPDKPQRKDSGKKIKNILSNLNINDLRNDLNNDLSNINNWKIDKELSSFEYKTNTNNDNNNNNSRITKIPLKLDAGAYRAILKTVDKFNNKIEEELSFIVLPEVSENTNFNISLPSVFKVKNNNLSVGDKLEAFWGSGYQNVQAYISIVKDNEIIKSYWTAPNIKNIHPLHLINLNITEKLLGGFTLQVYFVQENQVYLHSQFINVTDPKKNINIAWETYRSKLRPKEKETWILKITNTNTNANTNNITNNTFEMVATLYDQSLDSIKIHNFIDLKNYFQKSNFSSSFVANLITKNLYVAYSAYHPQMENVARIYPSFSSDIRYEFQILIPFQPRFSYMKEGSMKFASNLTDKVTHNKMMLATTSTPMQYSSDNLQERAIDKDINTSTHAYMRMNMRMNMQETAFFYPHLTSDTNGIIKIKFDVPDSLSKWKFLALAHGKNLESGLLTNDEITTQKELMITPNTPRFIRQGDKIFFNVKVTNNTDVTQKGQVSLDFFNILNGNTENENNENNKNNVTKEFIKNTNYKEFELAANQTKNYSFEVNVPEVTYPLSYRFLAKSQTFSDGEETNINILPRKIFVEESFPLWITNAGEANFHWKKLSEAIVNDNNNDKKLRTLKHDKLIVQVVSNPIWYAIMSLPYLQQSSSESSTESSDQIFNRYFANSIANWIMNSSERFENIVNQWKKNDLSLKSNLQKNQSVSSYSIEETPWYADALSEESNRNNLAIFFDKNRINLEIQNTLDELKKRMLADGSWPWFSGGPKNEYTTMYILSGIGKLKKIGIIHNINMFFRSISTLDNFMNERYKAIRNKKDNNFGSSEAFYLYCRSFFLDEVIISPEYKEALNYYLQQAQTYWPKLNSRMSEAHTALAISRFKKNPNNPTSAIIIKSLRERALHSKEMGMYWEENSASYFWYHAPIETQALMIELFNEMTSAPLIKFFHNENKNEIEDLKIWLLKQKQTHLWKTNKASAEAIFSLLNSGKDWIKNIDAKNSLLEITLGQYKITPEQNNHENNIEVEAGSGFYQKVLSAQEINNIKSADIQLNKKTEGISWGSLFWHYFEDISKITPHKTPLKLTKKLFIKKFTKKGPTLYPINQEDAKQKIEVGDTLTVKINLQVDRDMEFVYMKDMRASGTEATNALSQYKFQDGLSYYQTIKDSATHFYFDYLPKGSYVFEYELKVFQKGVYQTGMTEIKSIYAPEFSSHSQSISLQVK